MSYQVLARKWRPHTFENFVGQEHVLAALVNALKANRLHHAYLFSGTRGVGKTTIARILAKCLNCEQGITATPCGACSACQEIDAGCFIDLIEVDAASRTRVEDTKELLANVYYVPVKGRFKIYLIDEVHMLSMHSFNALLKTLEEPPEHVKFLFATTDAQKIPITVLSRCLQFNLKNMSAEVIRGYIEHVLNEEKIEYDPAALEYISEAAQGSMRDALSLTDHAITYCDNHLTVEQVTAMLGYLDRGHVLDIIEALAQCNPQKILNKTEQLAAHAPNYGSVLDEVLTVLHQIAIEQIVPGTLDKESLYHERIAELARQTTAEDIQLFYQSGVLGRRDISWMPDSRTAFEMTLIRMVVFKPGAITQPACQPLHDAQQIVFTEQEHSHAVSIDDSSKKKNIWN